MRKETITPFERGVFLGSATLFVCALTFLFAFFPAGQKGSTETPPETISAIKPTVTEPAAATEYETVSLGEFTITAYCPCIKCCGIWSEEHPSRKGTGYVQKTAYGTVPMSGRTIGVDESVIPFGTTVIIFGNEYVAEDRGEAVKGNQIDIYFDDHQEALEFGRKTAEVFVKTE